MKGARWRLGAAALWMAWIAVPAAGGSPEGAPQAAPSPEWARKMRGLESALQELLVDLNSDERFYSPKNFERIEKNAKALANIAHSVKTDLRVAPDQDPSLRIMAGHFASEAQHAYNTLSWGHRAYARDILKSVTGYCIACHTRNANGPKFDGLASDSNPFLKSLKGAERGDYFASVRQFDRSLNEYERVVGAGDEGVFARERALRSGLAVAVRVLKDPERAIKLIESALATEDAPSYLKDQSAQWRKDLAAWRTEPSIKARTEEGYYVLALKLLAQAHERQKYPADRSADVLYLRASAAVHDLLSFAPDGVHATEALYMAGLCYEVLQDLNLWELHEFYYLACIFKSPHSEGARRCFKQYEQSVYLGYTGSGGTRLPAEVREKLRELDALSLPETKASEQP